MDLTRQGVKRAAGAADRSSPQALPDQEPREAEAVLADRPWQRVTSRQGTSLRHDPRLQSVYGWLLRVKDVGSVWVNWSVAAMYTASDLQRDRCAP